MLSGYIYLALTGSFEIKQIILQEKNVKILSSNFNEKITERSNFIFNHSYKNLAL